MFQLTNLISFSPWFMRGITNIDIEEFQINRVVFMGNNKDNNNNMPELSKEK